MIHCYGMIIKDLEIKYQQRQKKPRPIITPIYSIKQTPLLLTAWRLLKKTSGTTKVNRQAHQLKKDDGTLTTDDTEKATMLNDYFCTVAEKLIGPEDEIQPLHAHSRENVDTPTMTSITISQKEIEEKFWKSKVKKATGPDGVSARLLKYAGMSIAPSLTSVFK